VAGECAATGLHGANRLASNSLLEGLVFGARVAEDVRGVAARGLTRGLLPTPKAFALAPPPHVLRAALNRDVGLERNADGLDEALAVIDRLEQVVGSEPAQLNMLATARLVTAAALMREESRGGHWRSDFPATREEAARNFLTLDEARRVRDRRHRHAEP
jgi:L-aspartate oxidase